MPRERETSSPPASSPAIEWYPSALRWTGTFRSRRNIAKSYAWFSRSISAAATGSPSDRTSARSSSFIRSRSGFSRQSNPSFAQ